MLGEVFSNLEEEHFPRWKKHADKILIELENGLGKIKDPTQKAPELIQIQQARQALKDKKEITKKDYIEQLTAISKNLNTLAETKKFSPTEINNFIFQARYVVDALTFSDTMLGYAQLAEKLITPSQNVQKEVELGFAAEKSSQSVAKAITKNFLLGSTKELIPFLRMQVNNMPEIEIENVTVLGASRSLLAMKLNQEQEKTLKNKRAIGTEGKHNLVLSLQEQPYAIAFDATYSEVASCYGMLAKIERLASQENSAEEIATRREKLLKENGLSELNTKEGLAYLDNLAIHLGFANAKDLYENYQQLPNKQSFNTLNETKRKFMDFVFDIAPIRDPLEEIKTVTETEYARVKEKMKSSSSFKKESGHYAMAVSAFTNNVIRGLDNVKRTHIITDNAIPENSAINWGIYLSNMAMEWVGWFQGKTTSLDDYLVGNLYKETSLFDSVLQNLSSPIDDGIIALNKKTAEANQARMKQLLSVSYTEQKDEEFVQNFVARMQMYEHSLELLREVDNATQPDEYLSREGTLKALEQEYLNYSAAFDINIDQYVENLPQNKLDEFIIQKQEKINQIEEKIKRTDTQLKASIATINVFEESEKTLGGTLTRWRDNVGSFFGYKTQTAQKRDAVLQQKKDLESLKNTQTSLNFELPIHQNLLQKAQLQSNVFKEYHEENLESLANKVDALSIETVNAYRTIESTTGVSTAQRAFFQKENALKIAVYALQDKLSDNTNTLQAETIGKLLETVENTKTAYERFDPVFINLPDGVQSSPVIHLLASFEGKLRSLSDKNILQSKESTLLEAEKHIHKLFEEKSLQEIQDPFQLISKSKNIFGDFPNDAAIQRGVWARVNEKYSKMLQSAIATLSTEELEKLYLNFKAATLSDKTNVEFTSYYNNFANIIAPALKEKTPKDLVSLDQEFQRIAKLTHTAVSSRETSQSWVWNPFGTTSVEHATAYEKASVDHFQDFFKQYSDITLDSYQNLSYTEVTEHLNNIENGKKLVDDIVKKLPNNTAIQEIQSGIKAHIEAAKKAKTNHVSQKTTQLPELLYNINRSLEETKILSNEIEMAIATHNHFDNERYTQYTLLLDKIEQIQKQIPAQTEKIDEQFSMLKVDGESLHEDYKKWQESKALYSVQLKQETDALNHIRESDSPKFDFYSHIAQKKSIEVKMPPLDKNTVSQGLLVSIEYGNDEAFQNILNATQFDLKTLEKALKISATQGKFSHVEKIFTHRKDAMLRQAVIEECIKNAFINIPIENDDPNEPHRKTIHYLVLNSNVSLQILREIADKMEEKGTLKLPVVSKNLIVDNDYENLTKIRHYFIFEGELLSSLKEEFESVINNANKINDNEHPQYQKMMVEIDKFNAKLDKIAALRKTYLDHFPVDNTTRRDKDQPQTISHYRQLLDEQATRILTASIPKMPEENVTNESTTRPKYEEIPTQKGTPSSAFNLKHTQAELTSLLSQSSPQATEIKNLLKKCKKNIPKGQQVDFYAFVSNAINALAEKEKDSPGALSALLASIDDPQIKEDNIRNAFLVAISHGQDETVQFLCDHSLPEEMKPTLFNHLHAVLQAKKDRIADAATNYFEVTLTLLTNITPSPSKENQAKMKEILEVTALHSPFIAKKYPNVASSWGGYLRGIDNDKAVLEEIRNLYIHSENVFEKLANNAAYDMDVVILNNSIDKYSPEQVKELANKVNAWEKAWKAADSFQANHLAFLSSPSKIENSQRLIANETPWRNQFDKQYEENEGKFKSSMTALQSAIDGYHDTHQQKKDEKSKQRQKPLLSSFSPEKPGFSENKLETSLKQKKTPKKK